MAHHNYHHPESYTPWSLSRRRCLP